MSTQLYAVNTGLKAKAHVKTETIQGYNTASWPRLAFQATLNIEDDTDSYWANATQAVSLGMLTGELVIGSEKIADIRPISINTKRIGKQKYTSDVLLNVEIPLDTHRIEWIEQQRSANVFAGTLRINLQVQVFGTPFDPQNFAFGLMESSNIYGDIPLTISETIWREKVLPGLGYGKVMIVELPVVGLESCKALEHCFKALEKAQKQFSLGLYDEAAGTCRIALDPFFESVDKGDGSGKQIPKLKSSWETQLGSSTYQWLDSALGIIKAATNKPHHSPNCHFDRLGAQMLLMITTALISYAAHQNLPEK